MKVILHHNKKQYNYYLHRNQTAVLACAGIFGDNIIFCSDLHRPGLG
jgi:hypothetical protein